MLQPRIAPREASLTSLATALNHLTLCSQRTSRIPRTLVRHASHAAQGRANGPGDSAGRRLGAKKTASEWVIPGNIIYKQRGTLWFPGENVGIGKDHTIYSLVSGYVRYYRNPGVHPKRRYIGVALAKDGPGSKLPSPHNAPTRRRLGMYVSPIPPTDRSPIDHVSEDAVFLQAHISNSSMPNHGVIKDVPVLSQAMNQPPARRSSKSKTTAPQRPSPFSPEFAVRSGGHGLANFEIPRAAEPLRSTVAEFDRTDRWKAWRVRAKKVKEKMAARAAKQTRKTKGKKSNKKIAA